MELVAVCDRKTRSEWVNNKKVLMIEINRDLNAVSVDYECARCSGIIDFGIGNRCGPVK